MLGYVRELESRIALLPGEIEAGLDPKQIAKLLGESLSQHFLQSGVPDTVKALQATSEAMTSAQTELSKALHSLSDSHGGIVAEVEYANNRLTHALEGRAKTIDALLNEWKSDMLRIWIPLIAGAAMLVGLFGGIEIQGCRDSAPAGTATPTLGQAVPAPALRQDTAPVSDAKRPHHVQATAKTGANRER
jgi:hypothetical protein